MSDPSHIRIVGDVHGHIAPLPKRKERNVRNLFPRSPIQARGHRRRNYLELIARTQYSIQVGDLGLDYSQLQDVDAKRHRVIAGNHDNLAQPSQHFLGDYGQHSIPLAIDSFDFFFIRGARSLDLQNRTEGVDWWPSEELDSAQSSAAISEYARARPKTMITHDCPTEITELVATMSVDVAPSQTNTMLQDCFEIHAPDTWIFGHYHHNWAYIHPRGTKFICIGELCYYDFDSFGVPIFDLPH